MCKLHYITYIFLLNVRHAERIEMNINNNISTDHIHTLLAIDLIQQYRHPDLITAINTGHKIISKTFVE